MQIVPGLPVIWREVDELQIGLDPRCGVILSGLDSDERTFVDALSRPHSDGELAKLIERCQLTPTHAQSLIRMLEKAGVFTTTPLQGPDAPAAMRMYGKPPHSRAGAYVQLTRGDYVSAAAGQILLDSGVGTITCKDPRIVGAADHPIMQQNFTGIPRYLAWDNVTHHHHQRKPHPSNPTVVVESGPYVINPAVTSPWLQAQIPIVHTWIEDIDVHVGPTTLAHQSACASCLFLHRRDADPLWPRLAMQAFGRGDILADISAMELAGAMVAREVLAIIDHQQPALVNKILTIGPHPQLPQFYQVLPHPECGCQDPSAENTGE